MSDPLQTVDRVLQNLQWSFKLARYPQFAHVLPVSRNGGFWQILLKKSFGGGERNFLKPLMRFVRGDARGPRRISEKRSRTFVSALRCIPTAELSKNQHLREFWRRSIFDFFNSIGAKRTLRGSHVSIALLATVRRSLRRNTRARARSLPPRRALDRPISPVGPSQGVCGSLLATLQPH